MRRTKSTKLGHIRYDGDIIEFLKTFLLGEKSDTALFNYINKKNGTPPNSTLKNAFNPNKNKLTSNIVQGLFIFVLKVNLENKKEIREIILSLNKLLTRICWEDLSPKNKIELNEVLEYNSVYKFGFFKINNQNLILPKGNLIEKSDLSILSYKGQRIILDKIIEEVANIRKNIQYKQAHKPTETNTDFCSQIEYYPEKENHILPYFVGRKFVFKKIVKFLAENKNGYFFLKADAGIGKTSFAIKLVNERGYPFHIINPHRNNTENSVKDFIKNICAQLICNHNLPIKRFPENFDEDGAFLQSILRQVSEKLGEDEKLVIVVDGIDELKHEELTFFATNDILHLPELLPRNIFFILTMRKIDKGFKGVKLPTTGAYEDFTIEGNDVNNRKDARLYIEQQLEKAEIQVYLKKHKVSQKKFLKDLENKSEGNFMYLYHVLQEIADGKYKDITLSKLPQGLNGYYKEHWNRMMEKADGISEDVKLKTIYVLANREKPISREYLTKIINLDTATITNPKVQQILDNWSQFFRQTDNENGEIEYAFYHKSFLDFLASDELIKAVGSDYSQKAKNLIADYYESVVDDMLNDDSLIN